MRRADIQIVSKITPTSDISKILENVKTIKENIVKLRDENREYERVMDKYLIHLRQCMKDQDTLKGILKTLRQQMGCSPITSINEKISNTTQKGRTQGIDETQLAGQINQFTSMIGMQPQQVIPNQGMVQIPPQMLPHGPSFGIEEAKMATPQLHASIPQPPIPTEPLHPTITKHQNYLSENDLKFKYSLHTNGDKRPILGASFSRNGKMIALTTGSTTVIVNSDNGSVISTLPLPHIGPFEPRHKAVRFSIDNNFVAFSGTANDCYLIQVQSGAIINHFTGHKKEITAIEFAPNGKWMITAGLDGLINVWSLQTFEIVKKLPQIAPIVSLVTTEDADLYTIGFANGFVGIYASDFDSPMNNFQAHEGSLTCLDISPLTTMVATTSEDCTTKIWNILRGPAMCKHTLKFHGNNPIVLATFSANDTILITAGKDSSVVIQNYKTEMPLYTIKITHNSIFELSHNPVARMFLMTGDDDSLSVWEYVSI